MKLRRHQKTRGSILILTLFFMVMISFFAIAYWKLIPVDLHMAQRHKDDTRAYYAADAGLVDSLGFLGQRTTAGNIDQIFADSGVFDSAGHRIYVREGELDGIKWEATLTPGPKTYGHKGVDSPVPMRVYKIESVAYIGTTKYRSVSAWAAQDTFAKKNWLVNKGAGSTILWLNFQTFRLGGDYHTNDFLRFNIPSASFWTSSEPAAVGGILTSPKTFVPSSGGVKDGVEYNNWDAGLLPYNSSGSAIAGRYEKISALGRTGVQTGADEMTLPSNTDSVAFGTWGGTPPSSALPATSAIFGSSSVNVRINGATPGNDAVNGLYIEGDVDQIDLEVINDNQRIRIDQGNHEVEVTFVANNFTIPSGATVEGATPGATLLGSANDGHGYTVIRKAGTSEYRVYNGQTNGAIYATGNINGIRGVTKGRRTVATSTGTGGESNINDKRITITGELTYANTPPGQTPTTSQDQLGLITYAVKMGADQATAAPSATDNQDGRMWPPRNTRSTTNPHYLYCSIFAGRNFSAQDALSNPDLTDAIKGGGFGVNSYNDSGLGPGFMKMYGSLTEGVRLAKGTFNTSTGASTAGYSYSFMEDPNLKQVQPPFFPSMPTYEVISWEEKSVFAY